MDLMKKVKKPVEAIQCVNTFSLLQRKMYNVLLANAAGNLYPDVTHRIDIKVLCRLMGYRSNDYETIKIKFRELRRMDIEWDITNEDGNKVWTNTSPLSLARVIEGAGVCEYEFTSSLVPFLDRPAQYAKFSLAIQAKFKSCYGIALYENCERYKNIGCTHTFSMPMFRKIMGVEEGEYLDFFALKRRVICKAVQEINQHADFEVEPEYKKNGRSVDSVSFLIKYKDKILDNSINNSDKEMTIEKEFLDKIVKLFGLTKKEAQEYLKKYGKYYVSEKINVIISSDIFKKGLIKNMAGYFKKALSEDYQPTKSSQSVAREQKSNNEFLTNLKQKKYDLIQKLQGKYKNYLSANISELILDKLTEENRNIILEGFKPYIYKTYYFKFYTEQGLENIMVRDHFVEYMITHHINIINSLMSFERYIKQNSSDKGYQLESLNKLIREKS